MPKVSKYKTIQVKCPICGEYILFKENKPKKFCSVECKVDSQRGKKPYKIDFDIEEIKRLYVEEKLSMQEIADKMKTYKKIIRSRLYDMKVKIRTSGESKSLYLKKNTNKNPNNMEGVKEKIREKVTSYHKNKTKERHDMWVKKISSSLKNLDPIARLNQINKSFETKKANGTLYQSLMEKEVGDLIEAGGIKVYRNTYSVISGKEIDIYLPDHKLAIEFNGLYWHSEKSRNISKNYHIDKTNICEKNGVQLIHIFEDEWVENRNIVESIIKGKLGFNRKIYARKCKIKKVDNKTAKLFFENNHIQGSVPAKIYLGLYYENELFSCISFGKSRFNKNYDWEILRFANKLEHSVIGGFSKLLKHFRDENKGSIITYADRRYFDGKVYESTGFKFLNISQPNYYYTDHKFRYNRQKFQKHKLKEQLEYFNSDLTEWENMQLNGWDRIWDCGNNVYILN